MTHEIEDFDRLFLVPLRLPWVAFLLALGGSAGLAVDLPRGQALLWTLLAASWLVLCSLAVGGGEEAVRARGSVVAAKSALVLVVSTANGLPLLAWSLLLARRLPTEGAALGHLLLLVLGTYLVLGLSLAAWLPAIGRIALGERSVLRLLRLDMNLAFWRRAGGGSFKYFLGSFFVLAFASSMGDHELLDRWLSRNGLGVAVQSFLVGYWSLLSMRLATELAREFEDAFTTPDRTPRG
jgi:hypothetical protein